MTKEFEQSFQKQLRQVARERNLTVAEVWHNVVAERFLVRLCRSSYSSHFILKGGNLLAKYVNLGRETLDIDFAVRRLSNEVVKLQKVFREIVTLKVEDGFVFSNPIVSPLDHFHMQYPGAHVEIDVHFGKTKLPLPIDLGFGDKVNVREEKILLLSSSQGPIFEESLTVHCYPLEFIFAEKLETAIHRGIKNYRMKDYHDLYTLISENALSGDKVNSAILAVFPHRKTELSLPLQFSDEGYEMLQQHWHRYRPTATVGGTLPAHIKHVVGEINRWLSSHTSFR